MDTPPIQYARTEDGVNIAYFVAGSGPSLLHFPHIGGNHIVLAWEIPRYRRFLESLASTRSVISYDYRGTGLSDRDAIDFSLEAMMRDVEAVVAAAGLDSFDCFAEADAAAVAVCFAAERPKSIRSLILWAPVLAGHLDLGRLQPTIDLMKSDFALWMEGFAEGAGGDPASRADAGRLAAASMSADAWVAMMESVDTRDASPSLSKVRAPTLVLHPREISAAPVRESAAVAGQLDHGELQVIPPRGPN